MTFRAAVVALESAKTCRVMRYPTPVSAAVHRSIAAYRRNKKQQLPRVRPTTPSPSTSAENFALTVVFLQLTGECAVDAADNVRKRYAG